MSVVKICSKCNSEKFNVNLVAPGVVIIGVTEEGNEYQLLSQGDLGIDNSSLVCANCGEAFTEDTLVDGMLSAVSNKYWPVSELVSVGEGADAQIMTQAEYEAMNAPTIETMNEAELRETAKNQQSQLEQMQAQMAQLMAQMAQLQAGGSAPAQTTGAKAQSVKGGTKTAPAAQTKSQTAVQAQQPTVPTNLPAPEGDGIIIDPSTVPGSGEDVDSGFFGSEAPF